MYILQRRAAFDSKLEIPAWRHFLHPFRQRHWFRAKRESSGSRSPERCGEFLLAHADRDHIDKQGCKKVYPADPLPVGKRRVEYAVRCAGRADFHHRQEPGTEVSGTSDPGGNAQGGRCSAHQPPMGSIQQMEPIRRSTALYAPPEVVDGKPPVYPYTPIRSSFENAGSIEEMMLYTELQSAVHAMIQRLEYSFTFNPSLLTIPKRKQQVAEILEEAEKYIWRIKEEMRCA